MGDRRLRGVLVLAEVGVELAGLDLAQGEGVAHDLPVDEERKLNNCFVRVNKQGRTKKISLGRAYVRTEKVVYGGKCIFKSFCLLTFGEFLGKLLSARHNKKLETGRIFNGVSYSAVPYNITLKKCVKTIRQSFRTAWRYVKCSQ